MAQNSKIEWTTHTFNPWHGCTKVSAGCKNCYAETLSRRFGRFIWGPKAGRKMLSDAYWLEPFKWNAEAKEIIVNGGPRPRVFCASMADVFEGPETCQDADAYDRIQTARLNLWALIQATPNLDWLLLTKRPENITSILEYALGAEATTEAADKEGFRRFLWLRSWLNGDAPQNVWLGTSVEDQASANTRIPHLLSVPSHVRFLSCEPLLNLVRLDFHNEGWLGSHNCGIHWVIVGGESGPGARPLHPDWVRGLRDQCKDAGVAYFFKQWGEYLPYEEAGQAPFWETPDGVYHDGHGLNIIDPENCEIGKGWHPDSMYSDVAWRKVGKQSAGRLIDGREWDEFPTVAGGANL